jgi:hypothetical protein
MSIKYTLFFFMMVCSVSARITYDESFWEGFDDEAPYEHDWLDIPDVIDNQTVWFYFNQTHHFLTGVERGLYKNNSINLDIDCFGSKFVERINWFATMTKHNGWKHIIQEISIIYQLYYMLTEKCTLDKALNDVYLYCWNQGCRLDELWGNTEANFLYMTRALLDAAIVWYEGVPEHTSDEPEQWIALSRQTGETVAEIVKEITDFKPQV